MVSGERGGPFSMRTDMDNNTEYAPGLYHGTATYYDRYRLPYPGAMIADLAGRAKPSGRGRLLDLACGTGQLAFPLAPWFAEVWAVDSEPDMIDRVQAKAARLGPDGAKVKGSVGVAEELGARRGFFELAVIGNAFHRLTRERVARRAYEWLPPGGHLALCWSFAPWEGFAEWQIALDSLLEHWRTALGADSRVPAGSDQAAQRELSDAELLFEYGFDMVGRYEFADTHVWTVPGLAGLIRSTSFLPPSVLGSRGADFDAELESTLLPYGQLTETIQFAYELARRRGA